MMEKVQLTVYKIMLPILVILMMSLILMPSLTVHA